VDVRPFIFGVTGLAVHRSVASGSPETASERHRDAVVVDQFALGRGLPDGRDCFMGPVRVGAGPVVGRGQGIVAVSPREPFLRYFKAAEALDAPGGTEADFNSGSDGTRTRDLRRDRPVDLRRQV